MPRYQNDEQRILITGRKLAQQSGGFVPRSHLRQSVGGLSAELVDAVLARYRIQPQSFPTQIRGRPVTVYSYEDFQRACEEAKIDETDTTTGYAAALQKVQPEEFHRLSMRILSTARDLAEPVGFVLRTRLKQKFNSLPADDLSYILEVCGCQGNYRSQSLAYELKDINAALEKLESQPSSQETMSSSSTEPATTPVQEEFSDVSESLERLKNKPW